jgi:hypothetical protein
MPKKLLAVILTTMLIGFGGYVFHGANTALGLQAVLEQIVNRLDRMEDKIDETNRYIRSPQVPMHQ